MRNKTKTRLILSINQNAETFKPFVQKRTGSWVLTLFPIITSISFANFPSATTNLMKMGYSLPYIGSWLYSRQTY